MTTTNLDALLAAADLNDRTDRMMLADAFDEAGRRREARRLRSGRELTLEGGVIRAVNYEIRHVGPPYGDGSGELLSGHESAGRASEALRRLRSDPRYYGSDVVVFRVVADDARREVL